MVQAATETLRKLTSGRRDEVPLPFMFMSLDGHSLSLFVSTAGVRKPTEFCALGSKGMLRQGGAGLRQGHNKQVCFDVASCCTTGSAFEKVPVHDRF